MATFTEYSRIVEYARRTPPEAAARNNNKSGHQVIMSALVGSGDYMTEEEKQTLKPWLCAFLRELQTVHGVGYVNGLFK